ncbi:MAG: efflux RND transporter periplasmic adaptor subunit [Alteromonadaceae bacterium]|nr:efflux RND transporter periplasmic adaptor subunit [Alteromonadaceae bacterium]
MSGSNASQPNVSGTPVFGRPAPWIAHIIVTVVLLVIAIGIVISLFASKPEANRWGDRPAPSVVVETATMSAQPYSVWVDSYGTAEALTRTSLVAEVNGRVVEVSPNIRPGKTFKQGDVLVKLDDRNFKVEVDVAASALADAELKYLQEVAQAELAAKEWNEPPEGEAAQQLALRKPQVAAAEASFRAAEARLAKAKLDLERTQIKAPFDGKVLTQAIDIGQVVSPSQAIADIYSVDVVEVRLPVKSYDLQHLTLPDENTTTADLPVVLLESDIGSRTYQWEGEIVRTEGAFDPATRMLYIVAQVKEPFVNTTDRPAMRIGQFVRAKVQGNSYQDVMVIPRRAVSQDFTISIARDGILNKRQVQPIWTDKDSVVIATATTLGADGYEAFVMNPGDEVILTPTANLPNGTRVKPLGARDDSEQRDNNRGRIASEKGGEKKTKDKQTAGKSSDSTAAQTAMSSNNG